ncbi:MAG: hypothetical protein KIS66_10615 [Fimbriimonadaceae bacterium]|nr:hypothetical protein [Fimbriimonadaceae bacterium]
MRGLFTGASLLLLWIAAALQFTLSPRMAVFGCPPDFVLAVVLPASLLARRSGGSLLGFVAGVLQGGMAGANLTHYAISRAFAGFCGGWSRGMLAEPHGLLVFLHAAVGTLLAQVLFMFLAPPAEIVGYLFATIGTAMYNGVIAIPVHALLRRTVREDSE